MHFVFVFSTFFSCICLVYCNKYSEQANIKVTESSPEFRIKNLNFIWDKAQNRVKDPKDLKVLLKTLKVFDKEFLAAKAEIGSGKDPSGNHYLAIEKKLRSILNQFKIEDVLDSIEARKKKSEQGWETEKHRNQVRSPDVKFRDSKLTKLWDSAVNSFSEEELEELKQEFLDHQEKLAEYELSAKELAKIPNENSVHSKLDDEEDFKKKSEKLKIQYKHVQSNYEQLMDKVSEGEKISASGYFTHPRVKELWTRAQTGGFSENELESLKEELKHFETRLEKLEFIRKETKHVHEKLEKDGKHENDLSKTAGKKLQDFQYKVDKYENYLKEKIEL